VRHRSLLVEGVQFHPESILTPDGPQLLRNFLELARGERRPATAPGVLHVASA
jgi:GMP synthase-like glutamine amidotransferase